jgi:hypothetical protein
MNMSDSHTKNIPQKHHFDLTKRGQALIDSSRPAPEVKKAQD